MKTLKSILAIFAVAAIIASCKKDPCSDISLYWFPPDCQNGGIVNSTCTACDCLPGYTGTSCQTKICTNLVCQNGGTTKSDCSGCNCPSGYSGTYCQTYTPACETNHLAYIYFENKSTTGTSYSVVWDGDERNMEFLYPGERSALNTVAKGQHTLKFITITHTPSDNGIGTIARYETVCEQRTINLAQCSTSLYYCSY